MAQTNWLVHLTNGSRMTGTIPASALTVRTDAGELAIAWTRIFRVDMDGSQAAVALLNGDLLRGIPNSSNLVLQAAGKDIVVPFTTLTRLESDESTNSLGMRFRPVLGTEVLFSIWQTRRKDYAAFAQANPEVDPSWQNPVFQGVALPLDENGPVVCVSWSEARAFCEWLTKKEQAEGRLRQGLAYRLPSDLEWSAAVGLTGEVGKTPEARNGQVRGLYPWGKEWPPPANVGNYSDLTARAHSATAPIIDGYQDGFAMTSPVGSFAANLYGLFDLGSNVWEWCDDVFAPGNLERVSRGAAWTGIDPSVLLSSFRRGLLPEDHYLRGGFRCVLAGASPP